MDTDRPRAPNGYELIEDRRQLEPRNPGRRVTEQEKLAREVKKQQLEFERRNLERDRRRQDSLELRDRELERLEPRAIAVLEEQLESPDPRIAAAAARTLLEHRWGKPMQRSQSQIQSQTIVYETSALD